LRKKIYTPAKKYNPEQNRRELEIVIASYDQHVEYLANFAQHDMKNAIHTMDSVLYTTDYTKISDDEWTSLKACLNNIRATFDNFSTLIPYSSTRTFSLDSLMSALQLLTRNAISNAKIEVNYQYPKQTSIELALPFQSVLQMLHNVILNAMKAVETTPQKVVKIVSTFDNNQCLIDIYDSGTPIAQENESRIFEYKFTTTGGSGIGLYHARYLCDKIGGKITVHTQTVLPFTKKFSMLLPLIFVSKE
jgi:signal transduction histidine kinase